MPSTMAYRKHDPRRLNYNSVVSLKVVSWYVHSRLGPHFSICTQWLSHTSASYAQRRTCFLVPNAMCHTLSFMTIWSPRCPLFYFMSQSASTVIHLCPSVSISIGKACPLGNMFLNSTLGSTSACPIFDKEDVSTHNTCSQSIHLWHLAPHTCT